MIGSSILYTMEGLKAMVIASTELGAGLSHGHEENVSIVLPATNPKQYPAWSKSCKMCGKKNHFAWCCKMVIAYTGNEIKQYGQVCFD